VAWGVQKGGMLLIHRLSVLTAALALAAPLGAAPSSPVAILYQAPALPGDPVRDGAAEFSVLLCVAQLRQAHPVAGLVCVGNHYTELQFRTQQALDRVALMGVPVAKVPWGGHAPANPDRLFIEARALAPAAAERLLAQGLARYGALPPAHDPARPTAAELTAIRARIALYQALFDAASRATQVAMR
jgi:hypothetical protein